MLWFLRHGDAADAAPGEPDAERPLTEKGRDQSRAVGVALARLGARVDVCLTSPRVRARDTAALACDALGMAPRVVGELDSGPFDPLVLAARHGEHVLLVGHEPHVSHAIQVLTGARVRMKKGGLAAVDDGELRLLLRPRELRAIAG